MVLDREFPFDERVEKEALSLIGSGHELHIACFYFSSGEDYSLYRGIHVHRKKISSFIFKTSAACLLIPTYFRWWSRYLQELFKGHAFDVIHVHDLPLSKIGYRFKKEFNLKLVCDQHEYYSSWIVHTSHYNRGLGRVINLLSNWSKFERKFLNRADLVITVEEPLRMGYIDSIGIPPNKIITVPNTPDLSIFEKVVNDPEIAQKFRNRFILFYAGGIDSLRGLELILDSVRLIKEKIPEILFLIAGKEQKGYSIKSLARSKLVEDHVHFLGWQPLKMLPVYMMVSHIGVFTPPLNRNEIHRTIATKIYQYCASGLPVIVTKAEMMRKFVEKNKIGFAITDAADCAEKIRILYNEKEKYNEFKKNGLQISKNYSWSRTVQNLINAYKEKTLQS